MLHLRRFGRTAGDPKVIKLVEARRRHSLGLDEPTDMGISKDLQEQLDRTDGEQSGLIEGGLGRLLDRFELSGMLSQGNMDGAGIEVGLASGGGPADISFSKRYHGSSSVVSGTNTIGGMVSWFRSL